MTKTKENKAKAKGIKGIVVFYIHVGQLPPYKAEAFLNRIKDEFRETLVAIQETGYEVLLFPVRDKSTYIETIYL